MSLELTKISETASKITLGWEPVDGAIGYRFQSSTQAPKWSHTWDATRSQVTFSKADWYKVEALGVEEAGEYPPPTPPSSDKLRWAPPALTNPANRILSNAARSVPKGSGDLRLSCGEVLVGSIGQIEGYDDVVAIAGAIQGGSSNSSGHIVPRELGGTFHWEGWRIALDLPGDAFAARWRTKIIQIEACYIEVTDAGTSFHADGFQTQEAILDELRFDRCTIRTDYQGIFMSNEAQNQGPERSRVSKTILSRVNFRPGKHGYPATWFFKAFPPRPNADPIGPAEMYDVWAPDKDILAHVYPNGHTWVAWDGTPNRYGCFLEQRRHANGQTYPFVRFSTSADKVPAGKPLAGQTCGDCEIRGDGGIWLHPESGGPPGGDFAPANAGLGYVSPGYQ